MTSGIAAPYPRLVADVGGSGARFGWVRAPGSGIEDIAGQAALGAAGFEPAIARYLQAHRHPAPTSCAIGIAAPITGDTVSITNRAWTFSVRDLQHRLGLERLLVINDFAALAFALPGLEPGEARPFGPGARAEGGALVLIGPGTGLGVSGLLATPGGPVPVVGEGGHVSVERVLSDPGIVNLHAAVCELEGDPAEPLDAAQITGRALHSDDVASRSALDLFFAFLGSFAGNVALTLGARGGVYIAGGIVARLGDAIDRSSFRERFEAKGRYRPYLAAIATSVIVDSPVLALRGANAALDA